jgi:hypothetical protein
LALPSDAFYLQNLPTFLQQGDIVAGVPLMLLPALDRLVLVRSAHHRLPLEHLEPGAVELVSEIALPDKFEGEHEYAVVSVRRALAMLMTATCDLEGKDVWTVWPLFPIADSGLDEGNLNAGKYANLYRLPEHEYFAPAFLDLSDFRPVRPQQFQLRDRVASITHEAQHDVFERFTRSAGRPWGYAPGKIIEVLGKYETGKFRCARCNLYEVTVPEKPLQVGAPAPVCDNCRKIGKSGQWYPLTKHRKS